MTLALNQVNTIFLAVALLVLGTFFVRKSGVLQKFCIPAPVVGGLLFAILATILKTTGLLEITFTSLQSLFMLTFFTTVGLGASFQLIKLGGKLLVIYWLACGFLALAQNRILGALLGFTIQNKKTSSPRCGTGGFAVFLQMLRHFLLLDYSYFLSRSTPDL
ncbi:sodium/glutamate symport carrier protein GltS [Paenibacillus sp. NAIST15-1]|nr:sodium/glutamate symport carrier protein GltS [Paenibacillus sp. NAIST15-1]